MNKEELLQILNTVPGNPEVELIVDGEAAYIDDVRYNSEDNMIWIIEG